MTTIVEFRSPPRRREPPLNPQASADIVIFPGIRYERHDEPDAAKPKRSKRPRDMLEIES